MALLPKGTAGAEGPGEESPCPDLMKAQRLSEELDSILEASYDGMFITDGQGKVLKVNEAWERICGISREYAVGKTVNYMVAQGLYSRSAAAAAIQARKRMTVMLEMTAGKKKGQKIMATATPIFDGNGEMKRVVCNIRDITELVTLKAQLEETQRLNMMYTAELQHMRAQQAKHEGLVAASPAMERVLEAAAQVAKVDSTVLITGESGVGKEVIAKTIHRLSSRSGGPLIKINCGAIPDSLLESELFGYASGAFTGARKQGKPGMFELAETGVLFLDEIAELPLCLQVKLLRVLQDHEIMRVGGVKLIAVDTRIIAATNKDLEALVSQGKFREDLFYRLNVISIEVPPLRNRKQDIPSLALHFLEQINQRYNLRKYLCPEVIDRFMTYNWPGNVRELQNVIERVVVMTRGEEITVDHLPASIRGQSKPRDVEVMVMGIIPLRTALEEVEKQLISMALEEYGSSRKAARALQVNQSTVVRKARHLCL
ncbi:MAG: sigma 54-interacting transcriptional regulator [Firmicutes bacterium]|nr:sigma 54-interacting transcriptional regulator [Bacillota bacterium]